MSPHHTSNQLWSIILAGGEGSRVSTFVHRWLGRPTPKQYCAFVGTRSMFQHTLDRASRLTPPDRIVTGFDMARVLALGADWCNAARGFMFALGCVQAQSCHTDRCPTGVATQNALHVIGRHLA